MVSDRQRQKLAESAPSAPVPAAQPTPRADETAAAPLGFEQALELTDPAARDSAIEQELLAMAAHSPAAAAELAIAKLPADPLRGRILSVVFRDWAVQQPSAVAAWLATSADIPEKPAAVGVTLDLWLRTNPLASHEWIGTLPVGATRQSALQAVATRISQQSAERQTGELQSIADPGLRAEVQALMSGR